jgi:hypothetical protein
MGMMIVRHKVKDYGQWRPIFDGHVEMQRAAGLINPRVYHSADSNKSEIVVVFDTEDTKMAKDFAASADLKEAMIKAGVLDTPTIYFLESIDWAKPPTMFVTLHVYIGDGPPPLKWSDLREGVVHRGLLFRVERAT